MREAAGEMIPWPILKSHGERLRRNTEDCLHRWCLAGVQTENPFDMNKKFSVVITSSFKGDRASARSDRSRSLPSRLFAMHHSR
jgi:hypothetical protein